MTDRLYWPAVSVLTDRTTAAARMPRHALIGMTEKEELIGTYETRRTWNGKAKIVRPSYGRLYRVTLSNGGAQVKLPPFGQLAPGTIVSLESSIWQTAIIPAGQISVTLERPYVPNVYLRDRFHEDVVVERESSPSLKVVNQNFRGTDTLVYWRKFYARMVVVSHEAGGTTTGRDQDWSLVLEESEVPA